MRMKMGQQQQQTMKGKALIHLASNPTQEGERRKDLEGKNGRRQRSLVLGSKIRRVSSSPKWIMASLCT